MNVCIYASMHVCMRVHVCKQIYIRYVTRKLQYTVTLFFMSDYAYHLDYRPHAFYCVLKFLEKLDKLQF
jgi:hypothetical protein